MGWTNGPQWTSNGGRNGSLIISVRNQAQGLVSDAEIKQYVDGPNAPWNIQATFHDNRHMPQATTVFNNLADPSSQAVIDILPGGTQPFDGQHLTFNGFPYGEVYISPRRGWQNIFDHEADEMALNPTVSKYFRWQWPVPNEPNPMGFLESSDPPNGLSLFGAHDFGDYHQDVATSFYFADNKGFNAVSRNSGDGNPVVELHQPGFLFRSGYQIIWRPSVGDFMFLQPLNQLAVSQLTGQDVPWGMTASDMFTVARSTMEAGLIDLPEDTIVGAAAQSQRLGDEPQCQLVKCTPMDRYLAESYRSSTHEDTMSHCYHLFNRVMRCPNAEFDPMVFADAPVISIPTGTSE